MNILLITTGYLIGSIPFAWIITRLVTGQDLRQLGSGNVGVMNTALSTARWAGLCVFLLEGAKGALAVILSRVNGADDITLILTVLAVVIGTRWSIWMGGCGGRGNTAGMTALILISWQTCLALVVVWVIVRVISNQSFIATRISLMFLPLLMGAILMSWPYGLFGLALGLVYLSTQSVKTDDHIILKGRWSSLWAFIVSPRRKKDINNIHDNSYSTKNHKPQS
jgi:glycerol-3-phosphate acyltransferase PlsY